MRRPRRFVVLGTRHWPDTLPLIRKIDTVRAVRMRWPPQVGARHQKRCARRRSASDARAGRLLSRDRSRGVPFDMRGRLRRQAVDGGQVRRGPIPEHGCRPGGLAPPATTTTPLCSLCFVRSTEE